MLIAISWDSANEACLPNHLFDLFCIAKAVLNIN